MKADCKRKAALVHVVFQLTIFMIFMKAKATAKMVEGCIESQLTLSCNETKVINISIVVLGDSSGCLGTNCCPKPDSCTAKPNASHVNNVHRRCNGRQICAVDVFKERIPCETTFIFGNHYNDFERIVYDCIDNGKMVEGCIESQLTLSCNERKVINISSVVLGDSSGCLGTNCCPKHDSCAAKPNDTHVYDVHRQCNGRQRCAVNVIKEKIPCGRWWIYNENNDFERIAYDCIDNGKMVEGCAFSKMNLTCNETKVINISSVVLGDSPGCPDAKCCPKNNSCTAKPNDNHVNEVHRRCNGQLTCTVDVIQERIPCESTLLFNHNNDFERITYICIDERNISAFEDYTDKTEYTSVTGTSISEDVMTSNEPEMLKGTEPMTIIIAIVCLLVLVIIIVLIIVIVKRKKSSSKTKPEVEMTDVRNGQNRIYANQNQDTNGNPNSRQDDRQNCASTTYEDPNNVVEYSVVNQETRPAADGVGVEYCSIDIIKSDHKTPATKPEDDGYSLAGDPDDQTCAENVYEDVESKQSVSKAKSVNIHSDGGAYEEPQAVPSGQSKLQQECHRKDDKSVSNSKVDEGIYKNIGEVGTPSSPSSPYEPMTPIPGQNVYANESEVQFRTDSLTSSLGSGSEAHTPYCEMRSPSAKLKDDGAHMLVDNELYSSH